MMTLGAVSLLWLSSWSFPPGTAETSTRLLEKMDDAYEGLDSLEASLTQIASYPQLGITDPPEEGFLQVQKTGNGMNVRLELTRPEHRILVVKDGSYVFYQPRIKQAIVGSAGERGDTRAGSSLEFLLGNVSEVREDFEVEVVEESVVLGDREATRLRLTPKDVSRSYYRRIDLWVDHELWLPIAQELVEPNGDEVLIRLERIRSNGPTEAFDFDLQLPDDVERVRGGP